MGPISVLLVAAVGITLFVLVLIFVLVPLFRGLGSAIGWVFGAIGWLVTHIFEFIGGVLSDVLRLIGATLAMLLMLPMAPLNVVLGRWSAANHFARALKGEFKVAGACLYRIALRRPLKLFWLHGILEGVEQRVPEAMAHVPASDKPSKRTGQFDGYTIVGSLPVGGSGAKLYIARPDAAKQNAGMPDRVVIKAFALTDGSSLPQIVRESRALEAAKQLGLVLEHGMDDRRFYYIMSYHPGDHLGILTRELHGSGSGRGLDAARVAKVVGYTRDLLDTLSTYHKGGLWHKDVKPENVIVHDGRAHLVDLGLVTPLRSAMTLTTHGTEYFRDPELVRQALRGVRVHEVNGAKFDIYAVGAVLYFMLENTFPAHGGLSQFHRKSPEALRWIVRRAMTDYDKRYTTADMMLADLKVVASARDPFAVKPADLVSMGGSPVEMPPPIPGFDDASSHASASESAATPRPETLAGALGAVVAAAESAAEQVAAKIDAAAAEYEPTPPEPPAPDKPAKPRRPRLRVTNWWTGEYNAEDGGPNVKVVGAAAAAGASSPDAREFRGQSERFHQDADAIAQKFQAGAISARRAAKEQIKAARGRAAQIRERARGRGHRANTQGPIAAAARGSRPLREKDLRKPPSKFLGFIVTVLLAGIAAVVWISVDSANSGRTHTSIITSGVDHTPGAVEDAGAPVMLVLAEPWELDSFQQRNYSIIRAHYDHQGYDVVEPDQFELCDFRALAEAWEADQYGPADDALEQELDRLSLYGYVYITQDGRGPGLRHTLITSSAPQAKERRRSQVPSPPVEARPYVVINDHPAKTDPTVARRINAIMEGYRKVGWEFTSDDTLLEASVREKLPVFELSDDAPELPPHLHKLLRDRGLGGVMLITIGADDQAVKTDVLIRLVGADWSDWDWSSDWDSRSEYETTSDNR